MPDTAPVHTTAVTPDPVAAALSARDAHKHDCAACRDVMPCSRYRELTAAWRKALRETAATVQIHTTPASG